MVVSLKGCPMRLTLIPAAAAALAFVSTAEARHHHHHHPHSSRPTGHSSGGPAGFHKDNPTQIPIGTPRTMGSPAPR
jgi:hypothetical protein